MPRAHAHRWKIAPPNERTSIGKCRCGETREFKNYWEEQQPYGRRFSNPKAQTGDQRR